MIIVATVLKNSREIVGIFALKKKNFHNCGLQYHFAPLCYIATISDRSSKEILDGFFNLILMNRKTCSRRTRPKIL